ncbi:hypothetical protein [Xenophilus sp. Marseille-Q4582]|uniref:hypothetical protein n=1 Tax=Xenophilus sp. Marseille-Q4582 TaxID=2866600 RepID=UPI001CE3E32B|nr:hypothetical protein [Xenophilus sp. Marseille-Q4582]
MSWGLFQKPGTRELHVIPLEDLREHECGKGCWCRPAEDDEEPVVNRHNAMDGREAFERGERLLS